ncbi:hypothetical protein [Pseudomonas cannabina]|uniref:hypothetical protein n=1 Tax=Pseudomonas cannabina TaxID=86840 RepID=UPI000EFF2C89|nr:hypothetical protein [Pseudomonas cannabina]
MPSIIDTGRDAFESLTHSQTDRTGIACARIARSLKRGVAPKALAEQLTANDLKNNPDNPETVTEQDILSAAKMHLLNRRRQTYPLTVAAELEHVARQDEEFHPVYQT